MMDYSDIQKEVYSLKYANDKADYLTKVLMQLFNEHKEAFNSDEVPSEIAFLFKTIEKEIKHYRKKALREQGPDVLPRKGRGRAPRAGLIKEREEIAESEDFITAKEVAEITKYKERYVHDLANPKRHEDPMPKHKIGAKVLFKRSEVLEWMNRQSSGSVEAELTQEEALSILKGKMKGKKR